MHPSLILPISTLRAAKNIAVVGLSRNRGKSAHDIPLFMAKAGYAIIGVNPHAVPSVENISVVENLRDIPFMIDILNVFRPSSDTDEIIDQAIERKKNNADVGCVWLQLGITSEYGAQKCSDAGIVYIEDTCIYVIQQYVGTAT